MNNIEVEIKELISTEKYEKLLDLLGKDSKIKILNKKGIAKDGFPNEEGVYLVKGIYTKDDIGKIDVYEYEPKGGFCCYAPDFGSAGTEVNDEHDCHVSVQNTGLEFLTKLHDFKE